MADPIDREAAYEVLSDYYHHRTEFQHMALRDALSRVPSAQLDKEPTEEEVVAFCERRCLKIISKEFYLLLTHGKYLPQPVVTPEIIRCKDCDNWQRIKSPTKRGSCAEFSDAENGMTRYTSENDFCSHAERRTDE